LFWSDLAGLLASLLPVSEDFSVGLFIDSIQGQHQPPLLDSIFRIISFMLPKQPEGDLLFSEFDSTMRITSLLLSWYAHEISCFPADEKRRGKVTDDNIRKAKKGLDEIPSGHSHGHVGVIAVSEESLLAG